MADALVAPTLAAPQADAPDVNEAADFAVRAAINDTPPAPSMQQSMALAIGTNPDAEAEARRVAARTGVPVQTVFAQPEEMKRKAALSDIDFDTYNKLYPASALTLSNEEVAKIAHDDTENMGYVENTLRGIGQRAVRLGAGLAGVGYDINKSIARQFVPEMVDYMGTLEGLPGRGALNDARSLDTGYRPRTTWEDVKQRPLAEFLPFALEQGLVSLPDMVAAVFTPGAYFTALEGDIAQNRAENDKRQEPTVGDYAAAAPTAAVTVLLERFATKGIIGAEDAVTALSQLPKAVGVAAAKEGVTEAVQNAMQYASETVGTKKGFKWGEFGEQALQGAVAGGPFGGAVRGATGGLQLATERVRVGHEQAVQAEQNATKFEELNALAAESKLKARDPLAFQNFIEQVTQSEGAVENVFVDPRALAQSGISLDALAQASPSIADQVKVALETGSDVKIPVSEYASHLAGTELGQAMVDHLKTDPLGMSRIEAQEFQKNSMEKLQAEVHKTLTEQGADGKFQQATDTVREDLLGKLTSAQRFTPDVNEQYATLLANFYKVQAARIGTTPEKLYAQHPVDIKATLDSGPMLDQENPAFKKWFGDSKVVDTGGKPLVVYHGTGADVKEDFAFDTRKIGERGTSLGHGFYFTTDESTASGYKGRDGGTVVQAYLSMKKPLDLDAPRLSVAQLKKVINKAIDIEIKENSSDLSDYRDSFISNFTDTYSMSRDKAVAEVAQQLFEGNDKAVEQLSEMSNVLGNKTTIPAAVRETLGYDGIKSEGYDNKGSEGGTIYVAWFPEQIKSVNNRGTFDPNDPRILHQDGKAAPTFYSALQKTLSDLPQGKGSPEQWQGIIKNFTQKGIKQEEIDWSGVQDWLKQQKGSVTKEQLLGYLKSHEIQVQEVVKGGEVEITPEMQETLEKAELEFNAYSSELADKYNLNPAQNLAMFGRIRGMGAEEVAKYEELQRAWISAKEAVEVKPSTKFEQYTLPSGKDYRELLITLPEQEPRNLNSIAQEQYGKNFSDLGDEEANRVATLERQEKNSQNYKSSHYDERNILTHIRFNERTDAEGKRTLFIEEVQSDWHQAGRDKGYKTEQAKQDYEAALAAWNAKGKELSDAAHAAYEKYLEAKEAAPKQDISKIESIDDLAPMTDAEAATFDVWQKAKEEVQKNQAQRPFNPLDKSVPDAPFKTTWPELAFKRALMWAVEHGYDKVAWTTGEQQAERYDLSKHVERVSYLPEQQRLTAYTKDGRNVIDERNVPPEKIADFIGKEAAQRLLDRAPDEWVEVRKASMGWAAFTNHGERGVAHDTREAAEKDLKRYQERTGPKEQVLKGQDLKIGGEGMKAFYDKMLPSMVNKLVKKWGGKVGQTKIASGLGDQVEIRQTIDTDGESTVEWGSNERHFNTEAGADAFVKELKSPVSVHSLDITPAMRESISGGLPLFQGDATARGSFNPNTSTITLLKNADLSTFLHESGHFFLETMNKLAQEQNAPEVIKQDMQTVFNWLGVKDIAEWNTHDLEWQREKHEQFARGFEAYLFEGKSPSVEMRGVFQRFRAWLLNVYRHLSTLKVELNEEVRGVFDRMLATTEQIKETEIARSFEPMFSDLRAAGMNEMEWQQYHELGLQATQDAITELETRSLRDMKFLSNARSKALKDLQRQAAGRRREVRDQVTKEIMSEPINQARQFLTRGEINGEKVAEGGTKLSIPEIEAMYGDSGAITHIKQALGSGRYGMLGHENAIHPDQVAEMFGFTSGDELVRSLLSAENPKDRIEALTDQRMLEKYGDLTDPDTLGRAADEAVHNEVRARFIATELNALQRATGGRKVLAEAAKRFAEEQVARQRVRDLSPARYSAAEARAAKDAMESFKAGGLVAAAVAKRNQLIQNYAARAAHGALREVEKAVQYFKGFDREGTRKNIDTGSLEQIDALLERFDLRKGQSLKAIDKRKSLLAWKAAQEEIGIEPEIPPALLEEANRKHFKDMTVEELRGLRDTIKQIDHLGRLKNKLLTAKDNRDFQATVDALVQSITDNSGGRVVDNSTRATRGNEVARLFKGFIASHRKIASLARELDGIKDGGPVWDTLIRTMNEAGNKEASMRAGATKELGKLVKPLLAEGKMGGKGIFYTTIGRSLNREERIGMALNTGNAGNLQRLLDGEGWTRAQIQPVLDSITPSEAQFVNAIWRFFESYRPEIGAKEKRVYGKEPEWVEPQPVTLGGVELPGGYYPVKYDTRRSIAAEQHSDAEFAKQQMKGAYTSATTRRSFTKSRADEVKGRPLLYSMDGLYNGINEIIHDLSWHEWLIDANRLLRNRSLDAAIRTGYGADVVRQFKEAVRDIAGGEMPTGTAFEKALSDLRGGAVVAGLGFNIVNSIINITGVTNSIVRVGPKWVAMGVGKFSENPHALVEQVQEKSEFMRLRAQTMQREINEIQSQVRGKSQARQVMDKIMFMPMTLTQIAVDVPTWWGAYQKALTEGANESKAVAMADQAVLDAQGGGQVKDLAAIQRGNPAMKLFTTFYGYFNSAYNVGVERTKATNFRDPLSVLKLGGDYLMLYSVPAVLGTLIATALTGKNDDWKADNIFPKLANDQLGYLMGLLVGVREITGAVQIAAGVSQHSTGYNGPAGLRFVQEFYNLATQIRQGEADEALLKSTINVLGILFKLPSAQINRTIGGVNALASGQTSNPAAVIAGPPRK